MSKTSENTLSLESFSPEAKALVAQAQKFADDNKCRFFEPSHLLVVLLDLPDIMQLIKSFGVNTVAFSSKLHSFLPALSKGAESSSCSPVTVDLLRRAQTNANKRSVNAFDLLFALTQEKQGVVGNLCQFYNITPEKIHAHLNRGKDRDIDNSPYFTNLSLLAKQGKLDAIIGRDGEVRRLIQILGRRSKPHTLLVGEHGVGKRIIVLSLVNRINAGNVPRNLVDTMVVQLNTENLISGAKSRNDVESRLQEALKALVGYKVIVYIRSIDALMAQGLNLNLHDLFGLLCRNDNIKVITATSPDGLKKLLDKESNLVKELTQLSVEPCTPECAVEVLRGIASRFEQHHNIKIGERAINTAVKLAKRYVQDRHLPESAIDLIDEAASNKMMEITGTPFKLDKAISRLQSIKIQTAGLRRSPDEASHKVITTLDREAETLGHQINELNESRISEQNATLTEESIAMVLGEWTGIPVNKFLEGEADKLASMEASLLSKIIDQNEAVKTVVQAVKRSKVGLRDLGKPIGSFLFFGPSGVGKTLLAKVLAKYLFDDESNFIRIDMSEFQASHTVAKLLGSPPGYHGSEEGGMLTEAVRRKPYSVVLFDEIEKAHPDVFNILLQVLDDGRLTDSRGKVVDFSNTIIILTSNIGSPQILNADLKLFENTSGIETIRATINEQINSFLRPEFLNRIDAQIIFKPLTKNSLFNIATLELNKINAVLKEQQIGLYVSDDAKKLLVDIGYKPAFGARPLQRAIANHIQNPLVDVLMRASSNQLTNLVVKISINDKKEFVIEY